MGDFIKTNIYRAYELIKAHSFVAILFRPTLCSREMFLLKYYPLCTFKQEIMDFGDWIVGFKK